jgi:hypothetical protein
VKRATENGISVEGFTGSGSFMGTLCRRLLRRLVESNVNAGFDTTLWNLQNPIK